MDSVRFRTSWTLDELRSENPKLGGAEPDTAPFTYCRKVQRTDASLKRGGGDSAGAVMGFYGGTGRAALWTLQPQNLGFFLGGVCAAVFSSAPNSSLFWREGCAGPRSVPTFRFRS